MRFCFRQFCRLLERMKRDDADSDTLVSFLHTLCVHRSVGPRLEMSISAYTLTSYSSMVIYVSGRYNTNLLLFQHLSLILDIWFTLNLNSIFLLRYIWYQKFKLITWKCILKTRKINNFSPKDRRNPNIFYIFQNVYIDVLWRKWFWFSESNVF